MSVKILCRRPEHVRGAQDAPGWRIPPRRRRCAAWLRLQLARSNKLLREVAVMEPMATVVYPTFLFEGGDISYSNVHTALELNLWLKNGVSECPVGEEEAAWLRLRLAPTDKSSERLRY